MINEGQVVDYIEDLFKRKGIEIGAKGRQFIEKEISEIKKPRVKAIIQSEWMPNFIEDKLMYQCLHCKSYYSEQYKYCPTCGAEMERCD